jgi:acetyl-CoA carboxylase biotin carboxyl carrier protein
MIDLDFLRGLIEAVDRSGIDSLEIARGGTRIRVSKTPPPAPAGPAGATHLHAASHAAPAPSSRPAEAPRPAAVRRRTGAVGPAPSNLVDVVSPMVGTFYRSPAPEAPPYVEPGTRVTKGQTLCILEAMKLMNEMEAEVAGTIREICVENGEPVEYGQVLFRIEPAA